MSEFHIIYPKIDCPLCGRKNCELVKDRGIKGYDWNCKNCGEKGVDYHWHPHVYESLIKPPTT
jgi:ribosomal protein L37AE/L43A